MTKSEEKHSVKWQRDPSFVPTPQRTPSIKGQISQDRACFAVLTNESPNLGSLPWEALVVLVFGHSQKV